MRSRAVTLSALAICIGLVGAACGGGDTETLSETELAREANAVCQDADSDVESVFAGLPQQGEPEPAAIQALIAKLLPVVEDVSDDLDDLNPPAELEARYDEAIAKLREGNAKVRDAGQSPEAAATIFAGDTDPYDGANAIFDDLGMKDCGGGEAEPPPTSQAPGGTGG